MSDPGDAPLVAELLRDLAVDEVPLVCEVIDTHQTYGCGPLAALTSKLVAERYPDAVRHWSRTQAWSSCQAATVIAATYSATAEGLGELLAADVSISDYSPLLVAAFLDRVAPYSPPEWLRSTLGAEPQLWEVLLRDFSKQMVVDVVSRLVRGGLRRSAIARAPNAAEMLGLSSAKGIDVVQEHAVTQTASRPLGGTLQCGTA